MQRTDVVVIGGGLAGLAVAAYVARDGRAVVLLEKAAAPGGRAQTTAVGDFRFNLGPHALYRGGAGEQVLAALGVPVRGAAPRVSGSYAVARGAAHALPGGLLSLLTTGLFGLPAKLETARLLGGLARMDAAPLQQLSVREWLARDVRHPEVRQLLGALVRLTSYSADHERMSAGAALRQVQAGVGTGVTYLDAGWQGLIDGLRAVLTAAGGRVLNGARADAVSAADGSWQVRLGGGETLVAEAVVIAAGPKTAAALLGGAAGAAARRWQQAATPGRAACLDLGLTRLPRPRALFALGVDRPLYLSVHSAAAADLAPSGAAMVHVLKYLDGDSADARADECELEGLLDLIQPGWRACVAERRFLPNMLVAHALPAAATGGLAGRPGPAVADADGVYVAGDWVGGEGLLADASLASARHAAALIAARRPAAVAAA